jgi:hypothetical protein
MIIYPVAFFFPGMLALFAAFATSRFSWMFLLLPFIWLPAALGRLRLLFVVATGLLVARLILGDISIAFTALYIAGILLIMTAFAVRCPRCTGPVSSRNTLRKGGPKSEWCPICGRRRQGIWPFQYLLRSENWDGEYHDEGGGPSSVDSTMDWQRDRLFRRWQRLHKH